MNTDTTSAGRMPLPELSDERVDAIEAIVFDRIADDPRRRDDAGPEAGAAHRIPAGDVRALRARRRRRSVWLGAGAAAAIVVVAAVIAPSVLGGLATGAGGDSVAVAPESAPDGAPDLGSVGGGAVDESGGSSESSLPDSDGSREIIANGAMTLTVEDVRGSAGEVAAIAQGLGGYVEQLNIGGETYTGGSGTDMGTVYDPSMPLYPGDASWVQVRIPADELESAMDAVAALGSVDSSTISRTDVTDQTVDLRAQVAAAEASVARLTELMGQATSVADLLAAESALAERQGMLESYRQQLEMLEGQVAMSSLSVSLSPRIETVEANPAGFGDGLAAGWNGLVATVNGIVVALGFLIPWIAIAAVVWLVVWGVVRLVRRRRDAARPAPADPTASAGESAVD